MYILRHTPAEFWLIQYNTRIVTTNFSYSVDDDGHIVGQ